MKSESANHLIQELKPGRHVEIIAGIDHSKELLDIRSSTIFDISPSKATLTLAQTDPRFGEKDIKKPIQVTFIVGPEDRPDLFHRPVRFGFVSEALETEGRFMLRNGDAVRCLVVSYPEAISEKSVRSFVRIQPFLDHNITALAKEADLPPISSVRLNVINISVRGLQIACSEEFGQNVNLDEDFLVRLIRWDGFVVTLLSTVIWKRRHSALSDQWRMGLKFLAPGPREDAFLEKTILELQRLELRRRAGIT